MIPTIGRIVHFWPERNPGELAGEPQAAIITAVHSATVVSLTVFPFGRPLEPRSSVPQRDDVHNGFCWSWPERVG